MLRLFGGDVCDIPLNPNAPKQTKTGKYPSLGEVEVFMIHPSTIKMRIIRYVTEMVEVVLTATPHCFRCWRTF